MIASNLYCYKIHIIIVVLITSIAFGMVHYGNSESHRKLVLLTFGFGLCYTPLYLKYKCLYPIAIYHGWLGAIGYFLLLNHDPAKVVFG